MPFTRYDSIMNATIGRPVSVRRGHIDPATFKLAFIYFEHVQDNEGTWHCIQDEESLVLNEHYRFDQRHGVIKLLDHPFWQQEGLWRTADRIEPLLYKGQVKWPQVLVFEYEHYTPEEVVVRETLEDGRVKAYRRVTKRVKTVDLEETDQEAQRRLGYSLPKYMEAPDSTLKERGKSLPEFNWMP